MPGENWSEGEIDLTVADYFAMLVKDIAGVDYSKTAHRNAILAILTRSAGSIEFKHQNISAVLLGLGHPWIDGYKPAANFQAALVDGVLRYLHRRPLWLAQALDLREGRHPPGFREVAELWIGPPPTHSNQPPLVDLAKARQLAEKFDVAERDARNRTLGQAGEQRVFEHERATLIAARKFDLADRVEWTSRDIGDGAGYDIASFEIDGRPRLVEVKTTNGWERTPFHLSRNELAIAGENRDSWHLIRLWNFARVPRAYVLRPPLENHVELTPTSFLANLH